MVDSNLEKITGLHLAEEELSEALKRLCFFAPTGSGAYVRELHEFIALQAFSMLPPKELSAREVYRKAIETIGNRFEFEEVLGAISRLVIKGSVHCTTERHVEPEARFRLTQESRTKVLDQVNAEKQLEREVLSNWKSSINRKYPSLKSEQLDQLTSDLKIFSYRLLSQHSVETLQLYYGDDEALTTLLKNLENQNLSDIWENAASDYVAIRIQEVTGFFREADEKRKQYIASLMHSIFLLQLTQLDPMCARIVSGTLSGATVYLDTNFVFRLVGLQGPDLYLASKKLAEISQKLGFRLAISPQTISEYQHTLGDFLKEIKGRPVITSQLASIALEATSDEDFITAYWNEVKKKGTYVDPTTFYEYYQYLEHILEPMNITVHHEFHDEILQRDEDLAIEESLLRQVMQDRNMKAADRVSPHVLKHDAYHRLLVLRHRRDLTQEIFANSAAWFLTCDTKLPPYDRLARNRENSRNKLPFCATSGQWLQTLRPYTPENGTFDVAQVDLIVSPLLRAYQRPPSHIINNVMSRLSASSNYSLPAVSAMLLDKQFLEQFEQTKGEEAQQDLIDNFYAAYADEMEKEAQLLREQLDEYKAATTRQSQELDLAVKTQQGLEARLQETTDAIAQLKADREALGDTMRISKEQTERERLERIKLEDEKQKSELQYQEEIKLVKEEALIRERRIRRQIAVAFLILILLVVFLVLRQPWINSATAIPEIIGAVSMSAYLIYALVFDIWRTWQGALATFFVPVIFIISFILPSEWESPIQVTSIVAAALAAMFMYIRRSSSNH